MSASPPLVIGCRHLPHGLDLPLPTYATEAAAGMDVHAAIRDDLLLQPGARALVPTGFALELPAGFEAQLRPRSGLALKHGVTVLNSPGTIDSDYRGEVQVLLINLGEAPFRLSRGDRMAQMIIAPVTRAVCVPRAELSATARGSGGYGSTGL